MNLRQLRDTRQIKEWLMAGEPIELRDRDRVIGRILPSAGEVSKDRPKSENLNWPDFEARQKTIFGDRVLNAVEDFLDDRGRY
ncbi:hypothetical protein ACPOL_5906 [Acidisarcina polymorpha]|uniref:Uncharacterized protein n=1 Tax=Acidisarcina polymorpha TaxID=2211140 RepID=A0A2Z5G852_9BACT|nr:hypothetical protein [Acidisarcina polymorpha]AXC15150.1 hypothetical protein ACPOL_5906 [Acidisarcina polymorpha]